MSQLQSITVSVVDKTGAEVENHFIELRPVRSRDGIFEFAGTETVAGGIS